MKGFSYAELIQTKFYWRGRNRLRRIIGKSKRQLYILQSQAKSEIRKGRILQTFIRGVFASFLKVFLIVCLLYFIEYLAGRVWTTYGARFPDWMSGLITLIPKPSYPENKEQIIELISVIASISGVVLALFYPVLATIASTAYAKVNSNIRNLIFSDRKINGYLRNLTRLASLAVLNLFALSLGFQPGNLILFLVSAYSIIMLYNILQIGLGVYELFDPSKLMISVGEDLLETINKATIGEYFSSDPDFQQYYRKMAQDSVAKIRTLARLCEQDEQLNEVAYRGILHRCFFILDYYLAKKRYIPPVSKWYPEVGIERSLLAQDDIYRQTFQTTFTNLQTDRRTDFNWLENQIIEIFFSAPDTQTVQQVQSKFLISVAGIQKPLALTGNLGMTETGSSILEKLKVSVLLITNKEDEETYALYKEKLIITEAYYSSIVSFIWNAIDKVETMTGDSMKVEIDKIDWLNRQTLYKTSLFPDSFSELEKMVQRVRYENTIEGGRITPDWYLNQEIAFLYLKKATDILNFSIECIHKHLHEIIKQWHQDKKYLLCSRLLMSTRELVFKLRLKVAKSETAFNTILKLYKKSTYADWHLFDFKNGKEKLHAVDILSYDTLPDCHLALSVISWDKKSQDLFAMVHLAISQELNKSMLNNESEACKRLFNNYPMACVASFYELRKHHENAVFSTKYASQPILDVLELSGLAYIYSKFHNNSVLWDCCCAAWDDAVTNWTAEQFELLPKLFQAASGYTGGVPLNFNESHDRKMRLRNYVSENKPTITDKVLQCYFTADDVDGDFDWYRIEEIFFELKYFLYPKAKGAENLITDRRLFNALNPSK